MNAPSRRMIVAAAVLAPAACTSLLPAGGAPPKLYTLTAPTDFTRAGKPRVTWQLLVDAPAAAAALDTERIALSRSPTSIDYFADAAWTDRAPLMVQALLVQAFENSGGITAVGRQSLALRADYLLRSELRHFEADYAGEGPPAAHVQIAAGLVKMPERAIIAQRVIEATARAAKNDMPAIVDAFNDAFHQAARQIVDWALAAGR